MGGVLIAWALPLLAASTQEASVALLDDYSACGQVCVYAVARLKDVPAEFEHVKNVVGPPQGGRHSLAEIERAARDLGLFPIAASADRSRLRGFPMPAIAHMKHSFFDHASGFHFVVLLATRENGAVVLDPPFRTAFVPWKTFEAAWTGHLLLFADSADDAGKWRACFESVADDRLKVWLVFSGSLLLFAVLITIQWDSCRALVGSAARAARRLKRLAGGVGSGQDLRRRRAMRTGLCVLGIVLIGVTSAALGRWLVPPKKGPKLKTSGESVDLGEFTPGEAKTTISLANAGDQTLRIERIATSCGCAVPAAPSEIAPGDTANVELSLAVTRGPRNADMVVYSNDSGGPHQLTIRWHGSAVPQLFPPRVFAQGVALDSTYERAVHIVYPGGPFAIVPEVVRFECDTRGITMRVGKNDASAFRIARTLHDSKTTVGYLDLDLRVESPTEPKEIDCSCRITVQYGKGKHVLTLPLKISFVGKVRAEPDAIVFSESQASAIVGRERRIKVTLDPSLAPSTPQVKESPAWLACELDRESSTQYVLRARVRREPGDPCEKGRIVITAGPAKSSEISVDVLTFALRK